MKKRIIVSIAAVLVIALLLGALTALVMPKYTDNKEGALIGEYYAEAGDHDVIFAGADEVITFSHTAYSKAVFGKGAVQAAKALMEIHPIKVAQESKLELKGNGDAGIVFNVIVPEQNKAETPTI